MSEERTTVLRCRSCGDPIVFLRTASGKTMPVNADTVEPGDTDFEYGRHVSHFSTCDQPEKFRKKQPKEGQS